MSELKYIAILGRQPEFGMVELESVLGAEAIQPFGHHALTREKIELEKLGGVIKFAEVIYRGKWVGQKLPVEISRLGDNGSGKLQIAISAYSKRINPAGLRAMGMELKRFLKQSGSVRLVLPATGTAVSAAELKYNKVLTHGFELVVITDGGDLVIGKTTAYQDVDWYSKRDYGRPVRDAKVGMMPPKLAQVLVNSTHAPAVWDPFCGTGQTMQEALLIGRETYGSDLEPSMVKATADNLEWLGRESNRQLPRWEVGKADARNVKIPGNYAIVSEGYLGPNLSFLPSDTELVKLQKQLKELYVAVLNNFSTQLMGGSEVTICAPAWRLGSKFLDTGLVDELPRLGYSLKGFQHAPNPLLYVRAGQVVGRQILILRKNG